MDTYLFELRFLSRFKLLSFVHGMRNVMHIFPVLQYTRIFFISGSEESLLSIGGWKASVEVQGLQMATALFLSA